MTTSKLDRDILLQTLRGYEEANRFIEAEKRARLKNTTVQASLATFASLYDLWARTGRLAGGNMELLRQKRLEHHIELRRAFELLAKKQGYL